MTNNALLALSVVAYTTILHPLSSIAANNIDSEIESLKQRLNILEEEKGDGNKKEIYLCSPKKIGVGLFLTGEWLFWKAEEKGLSYAIKGDHLSQDIPIPQTILPNGRSHHPNFKTHSGYRVGAGWVTPHDHWDIYASYTRYHIKDRDSVKIGAQDAAIVQDANSIAPSAVLTPGQYIYPFWIAKLFINNLPAPVNTAEAKWKLHLDLIDAELGKEFFISKWLILRPHLGLRAGRINQNYDLDFIRLQAPFDPSNINNEWELEMKSHFWGIGIRGGLDTKWGLGWGFDIYGNAAFSLLSGYFHTKFEQEAQGFDVDGVLASDDFFENKNNYHMNVAICDLEIGLEWSKAFCHDRFEFGIWGGYEQHIFFEQNQFMNFQYDFTLLLEVPIVSEGPNYFVDGGNLTTSGFVAGLEFRF